MQPDALKTKKRAALIVATLSSFLGPFMGSSVNVALPTIGEQLQMGAVLLAWVNTAFLLAAATFLIPFGRLGDIYGRKRIYMIGTVIFTAASIFIANATSSGGLITFRVLQGFGSSMIFATGMPILISVFPVGERGRALGLSVAAVYLGLSTGPFFGGLITEHLGWRFIFWLNLPVGLLLLTVVFVMLKGEWAEAKGAKFDLGGSLLLAASLFLTMYGFSNLPETLAIALTTIGVIGFVGFVIYESRIAHPVVDIDLFLRNPVFAFSNLAALINYAATTAVTFLLSFHLQKVLALSPQEAGLVLVAQPVVQTILSPLAGRLSDRIEPRTVASNGMALTLFGLIMLLFVDAESSLAYIIACLAVLGFGFGFFSSPNTNAIMSSVDRRYFGVAGAMVGTMRQVGMMFSMGIVMMIMALYLGGAAIGPDNLLQFERCMRTAFAIFGAMCFGGIFASLARGKVHGPRPDQASPPTAGDK